MTPYSSVKVLSVMIERLNTKVFAGSRRNSYISVKGQKM
jgi:hypothetical protein